MSKKNQVPGASLARRAESLTDELDFSAFDPVAGASLVQKLTRESAREAMETVRAAGLTSESLVILKPGDRFMGKFRGAGPEHEMTDRATGEVKAIATWLFDHASGIRVRVLGTFQLDREMPTVEVGAQIELWHLGQLETGNGRRVGDIKVWKPSVSVVATAK